MPLTGSVLANKDFAQGYQPLLLAQFTFPDGSMLFASTHNLNTAEGGTPYQGQNYIARIDQQDIASIQSRSQQGIDRISEVTVRMYNADQFLYLNYEAASGKGFKGALLKLSLVLMDIDPTTGNYVFSSDSPAPVKFSGICDAPQCEAGGQYMNVRATTSHNLARVQFPIIKVQQRCVNPFPPDAASRKAGASNMGSWYWFCGYNPDQVAIDPEAPGSDPLNPLPSDARRGNTTTPFAVDSSGNQIADGSGNYILCNYTKTDCIARGMYTKDNNNRRTGRFTAIQWAPANREQTAIQYTSGQKVLVFSGRNDAIYQRSYPMVYGFGTVGGATQWIKQPIIANVIGDGNATRFEVVICSGDIGYYGINQVVVNGVIIPRNVGPGSTDPLQRWNFVGDPALGTPMATGSRNGQQTKDKGYTDPSGTPQSDPYGSLATIEIVVYAQLQQSGGVPDVRVLLTNAPKFKIPNTTNANDQASWPYFPSSNPAYIVLDLLIQANYTYSELDLQTFITAAAYCDVQIPYTNIAGNAATHSRFLAEFAFENYRNAQEAIQAVCRGFNAQLVPNSESGLLQLFIRGTICDTQPNPIPGSNWPTAVAGFHADGTTGSGYVAYLIDESIIQQDGTGAPKLRGPYAQPSSQIPNQISWGFQDQDNSHSDDSISVVDAADVARGGGFQLGGQLIPQAMAVTGPPNFDQGIRIANTILAEGLRGNENGDTRGTRWWDLTDVTSRLEHLRVGHICLLQYQAAKLTPVPLYPVGDNEELQSPPGTPIPGILVRVEAIKPATNYEHMTVTVRWHEDFWYTDKYGQTQTPPASGPGTQLALRPPYNWDPDSETPMTSDTLFPVTDLGFSISQNYGFAADGTAIAQLLITGAPICNRVETAVKPPIMASQGTTGPTTGSIAGNQTLYMAISALGADAMWTPLSQPCLVVVPAGTNTNFISTPTITWDPNTKGYAVFVGIDDSTWTGQIFDTSGTLPNTVSIFSLNVSTFGAPDPIADSLSFQVKQLIHGGPFGDACASVISLGNGTGQLTFGGQLTAHQFQAVSSTQFYTLSKLANLNGSTANVPIQDYKVLDNVLSPANYLPNYAPPVAIVTVSPDPLANGVQVGDVFEMRYQANIVSSTTIGDVNNQTAYFPNGFSPDGTTLNTEIGNIVRIRAGTGAGQWRKIIGNTKTTLTVDHAWDITPDVTSVWLVEGPQWKPLQPVKISNQTLNATPATIATLDITNYEKQTLLVRAQVADQQGNLSLERWAPMREIWLWGNRTFSFVARGIFPGVVTGAKDILTHRYRMTMSRGATLAAWHITAKTAPTRFAIIFDVLLSRDQGVTFNSLFIAGNANKPTLAVGKTDVQVFPSVWSINTMLPGDLLRVDLIQSDAIGSGIELALEGFLGT